MSIKRSEQNKQPKLIIGVFGFGVVGEGLFKVLQQTSSLNATIKKVCIKNSWKKRNAPADLFTDDASEILNDENINVIVELIDDSKAAHYIVTSALKSRKAVVSANKKLIAENLPELLELQKQYNVPFLYEAAACASIPVIRNLEEYYDNDLLQSVSGVVNGSTNFILSKIQNNKINFNEALSLAQQLGFAESNPLLDVAGFDAANKLTILLLHAYGIIANPGDLLFTGIQNINLKDVDVGIQKGYRVKLIAQARKLKNAKVAAFVLPQFIRKNNLLFEVENENNGAVIESGFSDQQFFYGKGAGSFPTASAVLSDISALRYNYKYEYKKLHDTPSKLTTDFYLKVYISFDDINKIERDAFEWIEEWHIDHERNYLTAVIHAQQLLDTDWWKQTGISLILTPEPVIENIEINKLKKRSGELAQSL